MATAAVARLVGGGRNDAQKLELGSTIGISTAALAFPIPRQHGVAGRGSASRSAHRLPSAEAGRALLLLPAEAPLKLAAVRRSGRRRTRTSRLRYVRDWIPVIANGGFQDRDVVDGALITNKCDMVAIARPLLANPVCSSVQSRRQHAKRRVRSARCVAPIPPSSLGC